MLKRKEIIQTSPCEKGNQNQLLKQWIAYIYTFSRSTLTLAILVFPTCRLARSCSPCLTVCLSCSPASSLSCSSSLKPAACSSAVLSSPGRLSINTSMSFPVLAIIWANSWVWSVLSTGGWWGPLVFPNPERGEGWETSCSTPILLHRLSAC